MRTLPPWLKIKLPSGENVERIKRLSARRRLNTVCEEARCPNIAECWGGGTATFMVLGDSCTRGCRFCSVASLARPPAPDPDEPGRLAETVADLGLDYVVLTTVCRDDLPDQGAAHVARCIRTVLERNPGMLVEALIQDFRGDIGLLETVARAGAHVLAHNIETVERLTPEVRDRRAGYRQSLEVLRALANIRRAPAALLAPGPPAAPKGEVRTKSSLMLGLGETEAELRAAFGDLREAGVDILTLGQYLKPSASTRHLPVRGFVPPEEFDRYGDIARAEGFLYVASGPFVRSSYRAGELFMRGLLDPPGRSNAKSSGAPFPPQHAPEREPAYAA